MKPEDLRVLSRLRHTAHVIRMSSIKWSIEQRWRRRSRLFKGQLPKEQVIVTLASRRDRFSVLPLTLKSILLQSRRPSRVLVWIDSVDQDSIPESVLELTRDGVEIHICTETLGPYTKLIPSMRLDTGLPLVTADDDMYYHRNWLEELMSGHILAPGSIVGHRGSLVALDSSGLPLKYVDWPVAEVSIEPNLFLTGVGGVLYPPSTLKLSWDEPDLFMDLSPRNDDLWYFAMALIGGTSRRLVASTRRVPLAWVGSQESGLWHQNTTLGGNDYQFKNLFEHFELSRLLR